MVVTGAAQGVGEATARLMAQRGAAGLALVDRNADRLAEVAAAITAAGCPAEAIPAEIWPRSRHVSRRSTKRRSGSARCTAW